MSNPSDELRNKGNKENYPGFGYPLEFCPMRPQHKEAMLKALWISHNRLRNHISWAKHMRSWSNNDFYKFIDSHINAMPPNQHFIFTIGDDIVGVGSLVAAYTLHDSQIALWVTTGYQGKGIGRAIVETLEYVAFNVWGFPVLYFEHDVNNEFSKKLPQKCGFTFSHTREIEKSAEQESGFWFSWKKKRPDYLPDAIIQGRPFDDFTQP